jgi:hypothetical protein
MDSLGRVVEELGKQLEARQKIEVTFNTFAAISES